MLTNETLQRQLRELGAEAARLAEDAGAAGDLPPLDLAGAVVDVGPAPAVTAPAPPRRATGAAPAGG
jgi:hypothetical protein